MPRSGSYMSVRVSVTSHQDPTKEWVVDARKLYYAFARDDTIILRLLPVKVTSKVRVKKEVEWSLFGNSFEEVEKNASHSGPSGVKKVSGVVRKCSVRKCTTKARSSLDGNPRCHKHRAPRTKCNVKGCTKQAQLRGVADDDFGVAGPRCHRHGAFRICKIKGCNNHAKTGTLANPKCDRHGANRTKCNVPGCTKQQQLRKVTDDIFGVAGPRCHRHGAFRTCFVKDCGNQAKGSIIIGGVRKYRCQRHGAVRNRCSFKNCKKQAQSGSRCAKHVSLG